MKPWPRQMVSTATVSPDRQSARRQSASWRPDHGLFHPAVALGAPHPVAPADAHTGFAHGPQRRPTPPPGVPIGPTRRRHAASRPRERGWRRGRRPARPRPRGDGGPGPVAAGPCRSAGCGGRARQVLVLDQGQRRAGRHHPGQRPAGEGRRADRRRRGPG